MVVCTAGKALIDRQDALLDVRFAKAGDAYLAVMQADARCEPLDARQHLLAEKEASAREE